MRLTFKAIRALKAQGIDLLSKIEPSTFEDTEILHKIVVAAAGSEAKAEEYEETHTAFDIVNLIVEARTGKKTGGEAVEAEAPKSAEA